MNNKSGFALVEILIAVSILSLVLLSVFTGVSASINVSLDSKNFTRAMILAKTKLNEFIIDKMRGSDITDEPDFKSSGFYYSRKIEKYENILLGPYPVKRVVIVVKWKDKGKEKKFNLSYIYPEL